MIHSDTHRIIGFTYFLVFLAQSYWSMSIANYAIQTFHLDGGQWYLLSAVAYAPGIFVVAIGLVASRLPFYLLLFFACTLFGAGFIVGGLAKNTLSLYSASAMISFGIAGFYTLANAHRLFNSDGKSVARFLGRLKSLGPLSGLVAALTLLLWIKPEIFTDLYRTMIDNAPVEVVRSLLHYSTKPVLVEQEIRSLLIGVGVSIIAVSIVASWKVRSSQSRQVYDGHRFSSTLWPYYTLNFLAGMRSGVFKASVIHLLIYNYHLQIHGTAMLVLAGLIFSFIGYRLISHSVEWIGHRNTLTSIYLIVAINFFCLFLISSATTLPDLVVLLLLGTLFLIDSLVFGASVVTDSYLRDAGENNDYLGNIAMGMSLFSLSAFIITLGGKVLWDYLPTIHESFHSIAFILGMTVALIAIIVSRSLVLNEAR